MNQVLESAGNIYKLVPENIDFENTKKILSVDPSPLNVVLLQVRVARFTHSA